jgi:hypothetical protein
MAFTPIGLGTSKFFHSVTVTVIWSMHPHSPLKVATALKGSHVSESGTFDEAHKSIRHSVETQLNTMLAPELDWQFPMGGGIKKHSNSSTVPTQLAEPSGSTADSTNVVVYVPQSVSIVAVRRSGSSFEQHAVLTPQQPSGFGLFIRVLRISVMGCQLRCLNRCDMLKAVRKMISHFAAFGA